VKKKALSKTPEAVLENQDAIVRPRKSDVKFAAVLGFIAFLLYAGTIGYGYVLDDAGVIIENEYVQQGLKGLGKIFTSEMWHFENIKLAYYRPLALATFAIENQFFPGNPHVSHFGNVFLYALTAFFLYLLLLRVFKNIHPLFSFVVVLLFIAHPIHTEVVANIKSRDEILSFLNLIIAAYVMLLSYASSKTNYKWMVVSGVFFYLALLSKESAIAGIILFPLLFAFTGEHSVMQVLKRSSPFLVLVLIFLLNKYLAIGTLSGMEGSDIINYPYAHEGSKLASMFMIFGWCVKLIFIPYPLCYSYAYNQIPAAEWTAPGTLIGVFIAALLLFLVYKNVWKKTPFVFGLLVFGVTLIPAMAFVLLRGGILAERFLYAPALGFSIVISWLLWKIMKPAFFTDEFQLASFSKAGKLMVVSAIIFALYSFQTLSRNTDWRDDLSLASHDVQIAENNCQVQLHAGIKLTEKAIRERDALMKKQLFDEGIARLNRALQIYPGLAEAYYQKGQAYYKIAGNADSAVFFYNQAIMQNGRYPYSYFGLAEIYENTGKQALASYYYNKAVEANPYLQRMVALRDKHRKQTGLNITEFPSEKIDSTSTGTDNKDFSFYMQTGMSYGQKGDYGNAIRFLEKAVGMNPTSEEAWINLSVCLGMTKNYEGSIDALQRALVINPNNQTALTNITILYNHIGNKRKGEEYQKKLEALKQQ
jgi:tetratricopeptide (TPR) repeat protein